MRSFHASSSWMVNVAGMASRLGGVVSGALAREKPLEGGPDVFLALDLDRLKVVGFELRKELDHAAAVIARAERFDLAIAEEIGDGRDVLRRLQRRGIVGLEVVAV